MCCRLGPRAVHWVCPRCAFTRFRSSRNCTCMRRNPFRRTEHQTGRPGFQDGQEKWFRIYYEMTGSAFARHHAWASVSFDGHTEETLKNETSAARGQPRAEEPLSIGVDVAPTTPP